MKSEKKSIDYNFNKYYFIQMWNKDDTYGKEVSTYADKVVETLKEKHSDLIVVGVDKQTFVLPDFFSELYGKVAGCMIQIERNINPYEIKKSCINLETDPQGNRIADIDVYVSMWDSIHRKDMI